MPDVQIALMTVIAFSALVAVFSYAVNLLLGSVKKDIEHLKIAASDLKTGQTKLNEDIKDLKAGQSKLEVGQAKLEQNIEGLKAGQDKLEQDIEGMKAGQVKLESMLAQIIAKKS